MNESEFALAADRTLAYIADALEDADAKGLIEVEATAGVVILQLPDGKQFVVSKHAPTRQLWLSSPISGGLHFSHDAAGKQWKLADGRTFGAILAQELLTLGGIEVELA